jgi:hypothetical protein
VEGTLTRVVGPAVDATEVEDEEGAAAAVVASDLAELSRELEDSVAGLETWACVLGVLIASAAEVVVDEEVVVLVLATAVVAAAVVVEVEAEEPELLTKYSFRMGR